MGRWQNHWSASFMQATNKTYTHTTDARVCVWPCCSNRECSSWGRLIACDGTGTTFGGRVQRLIIRGPTLLTHGQKGHLLVVISHRALPRKHPVALLQSDVLLAELYHVTVSTEQPAAWTPVALLQRHTLSRVTKASGEQCPTYSHGQERCSYTPRGDVEIEEEEKNKTKKRLIPTCNLPGKCFLQPKTQFWRSCLWRAEVWTHWCYSVSQTQAKMCYLRDKKNR